MIRRQRRSVRRSTRYCQRQLLLGRRRVRTRTGCRRGLLRVGARRACRAAAAWSGIDSARLRAQPGKPAAALPRRRTTAPREQRFGARPVGCTRSTRAQRIPSRTGGVKRSTDLATLDRGARARGRGRFVRERGGGLAVAVASLVRTTPGQSAFHDRLQKPAYVADH